MLRLLFFIFVFFVTSCGNSNTESEEFAVFIARLQKEGNAVNTLSNITIGRFAKKQMILSQDVDLRGKEYRLPKGVTIYSKGGVIRNGTIVGNETRIKGNEVLFDRVTIKGTWNVKNISTAMFTNLHYENSLKDVVALSSPAVENTIIIEEGDYQVRAFNNADVCVSLCSNTNFILNGKIRLSANGFRSYDIIQAKGRNIKISGKGSIIGDRFTHTGASGEWGMGIRFQEAIDSYVKGLTIKECWGDCIYVGGNSKNVLIEDCQLVYGRRQGISVTKADGVTVRHCKIANVGGTNPQYAIDIEPNKGDTVDHVLIDGVEVQDCEGGFRTLRSIAVEGGKPVAWIGKVVIKNCRVSAKTKIPLHLRRCETAVVEKCEIHEISDLPAISSERVNNIFIRNNAIYSRIKPFKTKESDKMPFDIIRSVRKVVKNNQIRQY